MTTHPAIRALKQEIEKRHKEADKYHDDGLDAAAYHECIQADSLETAIKIIKPWLGGETEL